MGLPAVSPETRLEASKQKTTYLLSEDGKISRIAEKKQVRFQVAGLLHDTLWQQRHRSPLSFLNLFGSSLKILSVSGKQIQSCVFQTPP